MRPTAALAAALVLWMLPAGADAATLGYPQFIARADAVCLAGASRLQAQHLAVEKALVAYVHHDTATTRSQLADALLRFFYRSWQEVRQLGGMLPSAPAPNRADLIGYLIGSTDVLSYAGPVIAAVQDDDSSEVLAYEQRIGAMTTVTDRYARGYGFYVCGAGSAYDVRLQLRGARDVVAGTAVALRRGGQMIAHAGEVLAAAHRGGGTLAVAVIRDADVPLRVASTVQANGSGGGLSLTILDADASNLPLASGSLLASS